MKKREVLLCGLLSFFFVLAFPAMAKEQHARSWRVMHADSFPSTPEAAMEQCLQAAALQADDRLTSDKCSLLKEQHESRGCQEISVSDGARYDLLGMLRQGRPTVEAGPWTKVLGRDDDTALRCDLGDGVIAEQFVGQERSCGNLGIRFEEVEPPLAVAPPPEPVPEEPKSTTIRRQHETASLTFRSGFPIRNCEGFTFVPGLLMQSGGESDKQSTTFFQ